VREANLSNLCDRLRSFSHFLSRDAALGRFIRLLFAIRPEDLGRKFYCRKSTKRLVFFLKDR
jgi:hypothetical protein